MCSITSVLRKKGYEVMVICAKENQIDYQAVRDFNPNLIGVTVYSYTKKTVYRFCTKVKQELREVLICAGGYLPTYYGVEMLKEALFIDFVIRGEGERSFLNLVSHLEKGEDLKHVKGLTFRVDDEIVINEDQPLIENLDTLPFPARDVLLDNKVKIASIVTSRGCARKCRFCNTTNFWKNWRGRDVQNVIEEIKSLYQLGLRYFSFNDTSFEDSRTYDNYERITAIARGIVDLNLDISYIASFRAEFNRKANPQLMELLKKSGLRQVRVGIETANESDRKLYGKWATLDDNVKIIEFFHHYNIYVRVGFINFNPYSTFAGLEKNIDFLEKCNWANNFYTISSRLTVYKGTGLYDNVKADGLMIGENTDSPQYEFVDKRMMSLVNYIQSYFYLVNTETNGSIDRICNYKNYFQSIVYDFLGKFKNTPNSEGFQLVLNFEKEIKSILNEVNHFKYPDSLYCTLWHSTQSFLNCVLFTDDFPMEEGRILCFV